MCNQLYTPVHFSNKVTVIENLNEKVKAMECMIRQLEKEPKRMITKLKPERMKETTIGRIDMSYMSGKKPEDKVK